MIALIILAQSALTERVLIVENSDSPTSVEIAEDYAKKRKVKNIVKVSCPDSAKDAGKETMDFKNFEDQILSPVQAALKSLPKVDFIVLTKGVPIRR